MKTNIVNLKGYINNELFIVNSGSVGRLTFCYVLDVYLEFVLNKRDFSLVNLIKEEKQRLEELNGQEAGITFVVSEIADKIVDSFVFFTGDRLLNREEKLAIAVGIENILMDSWVEHKELEEETIPKKALAKYLYDRLVDLDTGSRKLTSYERISELRGLATKRGLVEPFFSLEDLKKLTE